MGGSAEKLTSEKRKKNPQQVIAPAQSSEPVNIDGDADSELGGLCQDEVDITLETIQFLAQRPALFLSKPFKELRAALHPLVEEQLKKYDPVDYNARVTSAMREHKWAEALLAMEGARAYSQAPTETLPAP